MFKNRLSNVLLGLLVSFYASVSHAVGTLPVAYDGGSGAATTGNWFEAIEAYMDQGGDLIGWGLTIFAFIVAAYFVIAKVNDARQKKAEWAEVGVTAGVGAAAVIIVGYFANQAANVI